MYTAWHTQGSQPIKQPEFDDMNNDAESRVSVVPVTIK
jgi:hypothetical protein